MTIIINTFLDKDNTIHSTGGLQPTVIVPSELSTQTFFGASTSVLDGSNYVTIFGELRNQLTIETAQQNNLVTTELFDTISYYGYIVFPVLFGVLTSIKQNGGEEQINAWVNSGTYAYGGTEYLVYRTYVPKAYQTNQTINFIH